MAADRPRGEGLAESRRAGRDFFLLQNIRPVSVWRACPQSLTIYVWCIIRKSHHQGGGNLARCTMTNTRAKPSNSRGECPRGPQPDPATWGEPEQVNPKNVLVEGDRLLVDEDIVAALMATINTGNALMEQAETSGRPRRAGPVGRAQLLGHDGGARVGLFVGFPDDRGLIFI
jgi:hypothetical protein